MSYPSTTPAFAVRRSAGRVAYLDTQLPLNLSEMLWTRPEELLAVGSPLRTVGVRRTVELAWGPQRFVLKHYVEPSWRHAVKQLVQPSRAWRTWSAAHRLAEAGISTPRPVACVERRWGPFRRDSYLMYPFVPGQRLASIFSGRAASTPELIQRLWQQLAELWQRLRPLRASLGDANPGNFIVTSTGRLWVIDLDKARFHRLAFAAAQHQERRWNQLLRIAAKQSRKRAALPA
jgi:hypothetical protein